MNLMADCKISQYASALTRLGHRLSTISPSALIAHQTLTPIVTLSYGWGTGQTLRLCCCWHNVLCLELVACTPPHTHFSTRSHAENFLIREDHLNKLRGGQGPFLRDARIYLYIYLPFFFFTKKGPLKKVTRDGADS